MKGLAKFFSLCFVLFFITGCLPDLGNNGDDFFESIKIVYPESFPDTNRVDEYHGVKVKDPYRWLEEDGPQTRKWIGAEQSITNQYLAKIPYREKLKKRLTELWNYERMGIPIKRGKYYYTFRNNGLQNQDVLFRSAKLYDEPEQVFNPNLLSPDGTTAVGYTKFSKDGSLAALQISDGGSDWQSIYLLDTDSGRLMEDTLRWVKFSEVAWHRDGFFYSRYPQPVGNELMSVNEFHQLYYHRVGTNQAEDELIFADRAHPRRNVRATTSNDERFLILSITESTSGNALYFQDLEDSNASFTPIVESFESDFVFVGNNGSNLLFLTNHKAPNWRLIQVTTRRPDERFWEEIIPESEDILKEVTFAGGKMLAHYLHNAASQVTIFDMQGKALERQTLPGIGTITGFSGAPDSEEAFFGFTSFLQPEEIFLLDLTNYKTELFKKPDWNFPADDYEVNQVWYESYDGTKIPMFVIYKKGLDIDGERPTLLYGYGGFDINIPPAFNVTRLNLFPMFLEQGGICAVASIRGGGEFGQKWHEAGMLRNKQKVFDDFQAAAEYLIANKYTKAAKLAIYGRSNGGLLVASCLLQRPDLYGAAVPAVGVLDMLRYQHFSIGWAWQSEYGAIEDEKMFDVLLSYSPLHNVVGGPYPATLITTADHDDRVAPAHSFKFAAALQAKQEAKAPILIRIDERSGHGGGKPTDKKIEEAADVLSFMFYNLKEKLE
ncbi:MAG: prolyl endopeptidase [Saprospiraceae bacterium]|nr:MAG: prolyl endopeptidase [Saprospiraceae bacterium]